MSLKLSYFRDNKGRNELTRLIFAIGGVDYEDELVGFAQYQTMRDGGLLPWGQLPTLTIDEEVFGQSCSIARYAAKVAGLYPTNDLDALRSDAVVDSWRDTLDLYYDCFFDRKILGGRLQMVPRQPNDRQSRFRALLKSELEEIFARYERILVQNGGQVCVDDKSFPCWADLAIYDLVKTIEGALMESQYAKFMSNKTELKEFVRKIDAIDSIQTHLEKYPYIDASSFFSAGSWWKRTVMAILYPMLELMLSIKSRVSRRPKELMGK